MDKDLFRPTLSKVLVFSALNTIALALALGMYYSTGTASYSKIVYGLYALLMPFDMLLLLVPVQALAGSVALVVTLRLSENIAGIAWQYGLACVLVGAYAKLAGTERRIIVPQQKGKGKKK